MVAELDTAGAFPKMSAAVAKSVAEHPDMPPADLAAMYSGLLAFAGAVYPDRLDYVDEVMAKCHQALSPRAPVTDPRAERQVIALLASPLERYPVTTVLGLGNFAPVIALLTPSRRRDVARRIAAAVVTSPAAVAEVAQVEVLFRFIGPLLGQEEGLEVDEEVRTAPAH